MVLSTPRRRFFWMLCLSATVYAGAEALLGLTSARLQAQRSPRVQATGTAQIQGVITTTSGAPLHRAQVVLSSSTSGQQRLASTDAQGRFEFRDVAASRYRLVASKSGYVTMAFGAESPHAVGQPVEVREGQRLQRIVVRLPVGGVITGRVFDEFGEAILDASVQAMRYDYTQGPVSLVPVGRARLTDDRGQYRLFGLPPGRYYVTATLRRLLARDDDARDEPTQFAPAYYPGTSDLLAAQAVTISAAGEAANIDFPLRAVRIGRVSGVVTDSRGVAVSGVSVRLTREHSVRDPISGRTVRTRKDGTFVLSDIPPGSYVLEAQGKSSTGETEFGSRPVTMSGGDVGGLVVGTSAGSTARGVVRFEGASATNFSPAGITVTARPAFEQGGSADAPVARVGPDWSFRLTGLFGLRFIRVTGIREPWALKAIILNGTDVTDIGASFGNRQDPHSIEVVLTDRSTSVTGRVTDARGTPVKEYTVLVFSGDGAAWGPYSRFVQYSRGDDVRGFSITGLPAGRYLARVFDFIPRGQWNNPDFLEENRKGAVSFALTEGQAVKLDLKLDTTTASQP